MANPIMVLSADTHLAQRAWAKYPGLAGDSYYGLTQLVDYCCNHELGLCIAGDVFDKMRPDPTTAHITRLQIDRMERQNLDLLFVQGQHELDRADAWLSTLSWWPTHINRKQVTIADEITAYGIDWASADIIKDEFACIPANTDLLVSHQVWLDLMGPRIGESECAFADVPRARMILTGDFHRHLKRTAINKDTATTIILSPGPVCMQSIDEDPNKQFFVLCDDLSVYSVPLKTRNCFRFTINNKDDLEIFLTGNLEKAVAPQQDVPENISKPIIHITYQEDIPEIYARLTNAIGSQAHLFLVSIKHKQETVTIETTRRRALADGGMEACLELLTEKDGRLYHDISNLLRAATPHEQLKTMKTLYLQKH